MGGNESDSNPVFGLESTSAAFPPGKKRVRNGGGFMDKSVVNEESVVALVRPPVAELNSSSTCCSKFQIHFTGSRVWNSHF